MHVKHLHDLVNRYDKNPGMPHLMNPAAIDGVENNNLI